jgi:hypothetical protein
MEKDWLNHIGPNPGTRHRRHCYAAGYKAGLLAGLRWAVTKTLPHYRGAAGIEYQAVEDAIAHVEATGELPEEAAEE